MPSVAFSTGEAGGLTPLLVQPNVDAIVFTSKEKTFLNTIYKQSRTFLSDTSPYSLVKRKLYILLIYVPGSLSLVRVICAVQSVWSEAGLWKEKVKRKLNS